MPTRHRFFDPQYAREWSELASRKRPERHQFFVAFAAECQRIRRPALSILELGSGPGFLAEHLLSRADINTYWLFDASPAMLELSRSRLARFAGRTAFVEGDFKAKQWSRQFQARFDLVVTQQAVHELRHARHIPRLYEQTHRALTADGRLLMADLVNDAQTSEAHFLTVEEHQSAMQKAGFVDIEQVLSVRGISLIRAVKRGL